MNTETGEIYQGLPNETLKDIAERCKVRPSALVPLGNMPEPTCAKCGGRGYKKPGMSSHRFVPCECTNPQ
jgi:hypothetical protein